MFLILCDHLNRNIVEFRVKRGRSLALRVSHLNRNIVEFRVTKFSIIIRSIFNLNRNIVEFRAAIPATMMTM